MRNLGRGRGGRKRLGSPAAASCGAKTSSSRCTPSWSRTRMCQRAVAFQPTKLRKYGQFSELFAKKLITRDLQKIEVLHVQRRGYERESRSNVGLVCKSGSNQRVSDQRSFLGKPARKYACNQIFFFFSAGTKSTQISRC